MWGIMSKREDIRLELLRRLYNPSKTTEQMKAELKIYEDWVMEEEVKPPSKAKSSDVKKNLMDDAGNLYS